MAEYLRRGDGLQAPNDANVNTVGRWRLVLGLLVNRVVELDRCEVDRFTVHSNTADDVVGCSVLPICLFQPNKSIAEQADERGPDCDVYLDEFDIASGFAECSLERLTLLEIFARNNDCSIRLLGEGCHDRFSDLGSSSGNQKGFAL
jgi:hypothetical protein